MEKAKARKIKKWDEVHGEYEVEVSEESGSSAPQLPVPERKPIPGCCLEREFQ